MVKIDGVIVADEQMVKDESLASKGIKSNEPDKLIKHRSDALFPFAFHPMSSLYGLSVVQMAIALKKKSISTYFRVCRLCACRTFSFRPISRTYRPSAALALKRL